jgi:hypothetical protein
MDKIALPHLQGSINGGFGLKLFGALFLVSWSMALWRVASYVCFPTPIPKVERTREQVIYIFI